jgi:hypothetical protein
MVKNLNRWVVAGAAAVLLGGALVSAAQTNGQQPPQKAGILSTMMYELQKNMVGPLPNRAAPAGYTVFQDPEGTGRGLFGTFNGNARSATLAARGLLGGLHGYFDNTPAINVSLRDGADHQVQALFSAAIEGVPVDGVIGVELAGGGGSVSVLFDRPASLGASFRRLQAQLAAHSASGTAARPAAVLQPIGLGDGSTISLPQGWRVTSAGQGSVDLSGSRGEIMSLGGASPVFFAVPRIPNMSANYLLVAPCCDPVRAWTTLFPQVASIASRYGVPPMQLVRVVEAQPVQHPSGQAAFTLSEITIAGRPGFAFYLVIAMPGSADQWTYYTSGMSAPADVFKEEFGTMLQVWNSYSVNPQVFKDRLVQAAETMQETRNIMRAGQANETRASLSAAEGWDQYIRGVQTIEGTDGRRHQVDNSSAQRLVDALNGSGTGHWRIVPTTELVK